ncbi:MAG: electron transport complex subunit RsxC [Oscillospiraceae bacterium]|nr:electron transport complex subunit RsxC [Oscillospiraceae bacterium]
MRRSRGISPPYNKNTASSTVLRLPIPAQVHIPMKMHSGKPAIPVVKVGEDVKLGQLIGEMGGYVSSPIHASVSGCVQSINDRDPVTGQKAVSITIASDGLNTLCPNIKRPNVRTLQEFYDAVRDSGAVGLGGAGYPAAPKLAIKNLEELDYMLINGAECEPYVTSDTNTMVADAKHVYVGVKLLMEFMMPKKVCICIEDNKTKAIQIMQETFAYDSNVEVCVLPTLYPQGERKVLVQNITGRIVPEGARLADVGVNVTNVTTVAVFARYIATGLPLIKKVVTVDGPAVKSPSNVLAPIGTPIRELFDICGGFVDEMPKIVLMGGPMMGYAQPSLDVPVVKTTNCLIACTDSSSLRKKVTACIKCGRCLSVCPMRLMPPGIETSYRTKNYEALKRLRVNMCVECGCCAYVCPAQRHLVQVIRLAKERLWLEGK